jgi:predicted esterase
MPVFTAHGTDDSVVLYKAAEGTRTALARGGASVYHHRYEGMEHIYTGDVLADAGDFIGMVTEGTWWPRNVVVSHPYRGRKSGSK